MSVSHVGIRLRVSPQNKVDTLTASSSADNFPMLMQQISCTMHPMSQTRTILTFHTNCDWHGHGNLIGAAVRRFALTGYKSHQYSTAMAF